MDYLAILLTIIFLLIVSIIKNLVSYHLGEPLENHKLIIDRKKEHINDAKILYPGKNTSLPMVKICYNYWMIACFL